MTILRRFALAAAVLAAATLLLEIGARTADRLRGEPYDSAARRDRIERIGRSLDEPSSGAVGGNPGHLLQPYLAWEDADTERRLAEEAPYYASPEAKAAFDVVVLGGSEAAVLGRAGAEALAKSLGRGREVRVHAYALEGYKQPQPLMALLLLLSMGHEPDLVLELDGLDDAIVGWSNGRSGIHPLHPSIARWSKSSGGARSDWELAELFHETHVARERTRAFAGWILSSGLWRSALLEPIAAHRLESLSGQVAACAERAARYLAARPRESELDGPRFPKGDDGIADTIARGWEEASISMQALCARRGIGFVHLLEPAPRENGGSPNEAVASVYPRLRAALARLRGRGIRCLDASELFRGEGFRDAEGRPTARGCEALARAAAEAIGIR